MRSADLWQMVRFAIVGGLTALIFIALVWFAAGAGMETPAITAAAYMAAVTFQYVGHAKFTFRRKAAQAFQFGRFFAVNALGLVFSMIVVDFAAPVLSLSRPVAALGVIGTLPVVNYIAFKLWAFADPATAEVVGAKEARMSHVYTDTFFTYIEQGSFRSARKITPIAAGILGPQSVLDVGCGRGAWARVWGESGVMEVQGVDGAYVDVEKLHIDSVLFHKRDLSQPFDLDRKFDLVTSLEVAEHLTPAASSDFVASLTRHGDRVMFSAAPPGQGGERHVNERPLAFWRGLFAEHGYVPFDFLRPHIRNEREIEPWYRYNTVLYVHQDAISELPDEVRRSRVPDGQAIADVSPAAWRLRRAVVRMLPRSAVDWIAVTNARRKAQAAVKVGN